MKDLFVLFLFFSILGCQGQVSRETELKVGGPCEGCEAALEYGDAVLDNELTLPGYESTKPKIRITGQVFKLDGKTPASEVILYIYHTDRDGIYPTKGDEKGWGRRHGYIRGWLKTDNDGRYTIHTFRPGSYPSRSEPEHIHVFVKESGKTPYYIDDFMFDDDPLLTSRERQSRPNRGGSGIVTIDHGLEVGSIKRDIILGLNIPDYK